MTLSFNRGYIRFVPHLLPPEEIDGYMDPITARETFTDREYRLLLIMAAEYRDFDRMPSVSSIKAVYDDRYDDYDFRMPEDEVRDLYRKMHDLGLTTEILQHRDAPETTEKWRKSCLPWLVK